MECLWAVECLNSLWFFGNIFSGAWPLSSAAAAKETEEKEPVENQANEPEDEAAQAKPVAQTSEDPLLQCPRCGNLDAEVAEPGATTSPTGEAAGTPESAEEEPKLDERRGRSKRRKRRKRSKRMFYERRRRAPGELDLGCEGKEFHGLEENHFLGSRRGGFGVAGEIQAMKEEMPPLSDGIAMREHLRSWAIAVACAVK
ncbi:uncharacterized protein J3R85_015820 [Psidium guajava]|nr:uncharacterized protein J3R85_015820 [Psidium guajava]